MVFLGAYDRKSRSHAKRVCIVGISVLVWVCYDNAVYLKSIRAVRCKDMLQRNNRPYPCDLELATSEP